MSASVTAGDDYWPELRFGDWSESAETLHMWTQIIGKIRMVQSPWMNHSWHVTLYVTPRGLTTGTIPHGNLTFSIDFDFIDHQLILRSCDGRVERVALEPQTTADFYGSVMECLDRLGLPVRINVVPNEVEQAIPFPEDRVHKTYDPLAINRFWRVLYQADRVFRSFRAEFPGKASPSHFFWGSFYIEVTRYSVRPVPDRPGRLPNLPIWVGQGAYSQEVRSAGFWPGGAAYPEAIFYSYAYPSPPGFGEAAIEPSAAFWSPELGEFVLPYEAVRTAEDPDRVLLAFLNSTYDAAANLGRWDLGGCERRHFPPK